MKSKLLLPGVLFLTLGLCGSASAQNYIEKKVSDANGNVNLVVFNKTASKGLSVESLFKDVLKLQNGEELRLIKSETDFTGRAVDAKYQMYIGNIKVEGAVYNLHYENGSLISMNGEVYPAANKISQQTISAQTALDIAIKSIGASQYMWDDAAYMATSDYKKPTGELVYFPIFGQEKNTLILAYKFDIFAATPISRDYIYVAASTGRIIGKDAIMKHASGNYTPATAEHNDHVGAMPATALLQPLVTGTAATRYSGSQNIETTLSAGNYILHDTTRGNGVRTFNLKKSTSLGSAVEFQDADNNWTATEYDNATFDNAALDAHWGVEKTYDYFKTTFNRNSYDGNGTLLKSYVHYGNSYENAGWTGSEMIYGDGASYFKPLTAFDVTAHELGHGVCSSSAALVYQRESGALNEALSDIWGAVAEKTYAPTKQMWLIGEDITKISPGYLRSMSNPKSGNPAQPDTYRGLNWYPATVEEGCATPSSSTNDNCGVHYNSGVINHWFYILSEGKTGTNDLGNSYSVTGITYEKAAKIVYRLETVHLSANSNFRNARDYGIQAAKFLYGADSPEAIATQDAFYAVGIGPKYLAIPDTTAPTAPSNLIAKNITGTQALLEWNAATDANGIESYIIYKNGVQTATVAGNKLSYQATGLTKNTAYSFYVTAMDPYDNVSTASNTATFTTANTLNYCVVTSNNTADEKIQRVQFNTIDNPSTSTAGYEDFSYLSTTVKKNKPYTMTITPQWTSTIYNEGYAVFVDWNNDGDFLDAGETALTIAASKNTPVTGTITPPTTYTYTGPVRMRVMMKYNSIPVSACTNLDYGQVEDYTLNVEDPELAVTDLSAQATAIYPNPVKDVLTIQTKQNGEYSYKVINVSGQVVTTGKTTEKKVNVEKLTVGTYILELTDVNGKTTSNKFIKK